MKFAVYVGTPIAVTYVLAFGSYGVLERSIENRAYVVYPPEGPPPPSMRDLRERAAQLEKRRDTVVDAPRQT
jgi:protein PET100, fungi type